MSSFKETLETMRAVVDGNGKVKLNRFSKKKFSDLLTALANDDTFVTQVARGVNGGTEAVVEDVAVTKDFRKWLKKQIEKCGVDRMESEKVLDTSEFIIEDMNPFYDFFCTAMIEYMNAGNCFQFPTRPDFEATLSTKRVDKKTVTKDAYTPGKKDERQFLGTFTTHYGEHIEMKVSSSCPKWAKKKEKAN